MGENFENTAQNSLKITSFSNSQSHYFCCSSLENADRSLLFALKTALIIPITISGLKVGIFSFMCYLWGI